MNPSMNIFVLMYFLNDVLLYTYYSELNAEKIIYEEM